MSDQSESVIENKPAEENTHPKINLGEGDHREILQTSKRKIEVIGAKNKVEDAIKNIEENGELNLRANIEGRSSEEIVDIIEFNTGIKIDKDFKQLEKEENVLKINEWLEIEVGTDEYSGVLGLYIC